MDDERRNALRSAFDQVKRRAGQRRLAITIEGDGSLEVEDPDAEVYGSASDSDPVLPGRGPKRREDPDAEVYGLASDEDKELPGRRRGR